jgi:hypothetical protein
VVRALSFLALTACGSEAGPGDDDNSAATHAGGSAGTAGSGALAGAGSGGASASGGAGGTAGSSVNGGAGGGSGVGAGGGGNVSGVGGSASGAGGAGGAAGTGGSGASAGASGTGAGGSGGDGGSGGSAGVSGASGSAGTGGAGGEFSCAVGPVPEEIRQEWGVDPFYRKYADANGLPVMGSSAPSDESITLACQLVVEMVSMRDDVRLALIDNQVFFAMLGTNELTNEIPEYSYMPDSINQRARGLGGNPGLCSEEGILCGPTDRWRGESICVHEFAHTISIYGLYDADPTFEDRLEEAYQNARDAGLFANTYAMENAQEYWGEGVQDWYYTNLESDPPNGVHGPIDKREELLEYDPELYDLIAEWLSPDVSWDDCYRDG